MRWIKVWAVSLVVLLLGGCSMQAYQKQIYAMDTMMTLTVWGDSSALEDLQQLLQKSEAQLSVTKPASVVSRLNAGEVVEPAEDIYTLLKDAAALGETTGGNLDICLYPVTRLWGFTTGQYQVPTEAELAEAMSHTGNHQLMLEKGIARLEPGAALDLGAVAKGWSGAQCVRLLEENPDVRCAMLSLGGNIQTYGIKEGGEPWRIGIQNPLGDGLAGVLELEGTWAVVTSGGYERYFEENGKIYTHIIDPATGYPVENDLVSVTIVSKDGLQADGLSTALYVMGLEKATNFWREYGDFEAVFITKDGRLYVTSGLQEVLKAPEGEVVVLEQ